MSRQKVGAFLMGWALALFTVVVVTYAWTNNRDSGFYRNPITAVTENGGSLMLAASILLAIYGFVLLHAGDKAGPHN